jgi:hypothetical protein
VQLHATPGERQVHRLVVALVEERHHRGVQDRIQGCRVHQVVALGQPVGQAHHAADLIAVPPGLAKPAECGSVAQAAVGQDGVELVHVDLFDVGRQPVAVRGD